MKKVIIISYGFIAKIGKNEVQAEDYDEFIIYDDEEFDMERAREEILEEISGGMTLLPGFRGIEMKDIEVNVKDGYIKEVL